MENHKKHPDLYKKTFKGGIWLSFGRTIQLILAYGKWFVLAKLLSPRDIGTFGIAGLFLEFLNTITQTGFQKALIQKKEEVHSYLNSAWTIGIFRGLLLMILLWIAAPSAVHFYEGSWEWKKTDLKKPVEFLRAVHKQEDPLARYIQRQFSQPSLELLLQIQDSAMQQELDVAPILSDLNAMCGRNDLQNKSFYKDISLSPFAQKLLNSELEGLQLYRANRLLLEDAYPEFLQKKIVNKPELILIIRVFAVLLLISSFGNISLIYFQKDLQFHKQAALKTSSSLLTIGITIGLAFVYRNAWALVWGRAAGALFNLIFGYWLQPYKPRIELDLSKIRHLWKFGKWITISGMLGFLLAQGDDFFVGKLLGTAALGYYLMAYKISNLPTTEITNVLLQVSFSAYSKIQDDTERLNAAYMKMIYLVTFVTFLFSGLICLFAHDFVTRFMDPRWMPIVSCIQILALWGLIRPLGATSGAVFMSRGCPSYVTWLQSFKLFILALLIYPFTRSYGIMGTGMAIFFSSLITQFPVTWYLAKILGCKIGSLLRPLWAPLAGAGGMALFVLIIRCRISGEISLIGFIFLVFTACLVYLGITLLVDCLFGRRLGPLCMEQLRIIRNAIKNYV